MSKRSIIIGVGVIVLAIGWYAFRPELLFVNQTVHEEFPGGTQMASIENGPMAVTKGILSPDSGSEIFMQLLVSIQYLTSQDSGNCNRLSREDS